MSAPTPGAARHAICDLEDPLRDTAAKLELLVEALTPAKAALPQAGLHRLLADMLRSMTEAVELWEIASTGSRGLSRSPPPEPIAADLVQQAERNVQYSAAWARECREAAAIDVGFTL